MMRMLPLIVGSFVFAAGAPPGMAEMRGQERPWWEASNCSGLKGASWIECQKAISQNKRDRKAGRQPSNQAWWDKSKCLGLEGLAWSTCQKARSADKRGPATRADPWTRNECLGLAGLSFVECHRGLKR